jgi:predicted XRE-type DNA-binding protein
MLLIAKAIERRGLTQTQAAKLLGISQSDVSNIMRGRGRIYSTNKLFALLGNLGGGITIEAKIGRKTERIAVYA